MNVIKSPHDVLKETYGFESFRPGQFEVIDGLLSGHDVLAIFKTSGGKSLCYQVPALCTEGTAIVVSPLISLMKDQVDTLNNLGIPSAFINSTQTAEERTEVMNNFKNGEYKLFYISPERLSVDFFYTLCETPISFVAVDEAHCVSMYGKDFRPSYTLIGQFFDTVGFKKGERIPRIALTATAPVEVREEVKKLVSMENVIEFIGSFERDNIDFTVHPTENKLSTMVDLIRQYGNEPLIVYCATVKAVHQVYKRLKSEGIGASMYHGKLTAEEKQVNQEGFVNGDIDIMVATCAFGMGVDKSDVRTVIHYQMSANLENYYQEAGRAGRDGSQSRAILLFSKDDRNIHDFFIANAYPSQYEVKMVHTALKALNKDLFPLDTNLENLAQLMPNTFETGKLLNILELLSEHGKASVVFKEDQTSSFIIEAVYGQAEQIDLSYMTTLRQDALLSLGKMVDYAKTGSCRNTVVMKHFGQKTKGDCGHCDNCFNKRYFVDKEALVPSEYVIQALNCLFETGSKYSINTLIPILQGRKSPLITRYNLNELESYGSLSAWTEQGIKDLYTAISKSALIYFKAGGKPTLNALGEEVIDGVTQPSVKLNLTKRSMVTREVFNRDFIQKASVKRAVGIDLADIDFSLVDILKKGRRYLATHMNTQPKLVMNEATLFNIARRRPDSKNDLVKMGIRESHVSKHGDAILKVLGICFNEHLKGETLANF